MFWCNFCGKPENECGSLVMGPGVAICNDCVAQAFWILVKERNMSVELVKEIK